MISRCGILTKKSSMTMEEFRDFWFNVHGPIACVMKNMRRYHQHLVVERIKEDCPSAVIDGYSELYFDDIHDMEEGIASLAGAGSNDLPNFCDDCRLLIFSKKTVIRVPDEYKDKKLIKRVIFMSRGENVSAEKFQNDWWEAHAQLINEVPGILGYAQNVVIDRIVGGQHVPHSQLPIDGMAELWFEDKESMERVLASEAFAKAAAQGKDFIGSSTTYIIETAEYPIPGEQQL